jgi:DNA-directed RNA polymerase specialized sigma24 family protein
MSPLTGRPPTYMLLDEKGQRLNSQVHDALTSLVPELLRQFPVLRDEPLLLEALERAGRKISRRERRSGPIEELHAYARITLQNTAKSQLRLGRGRLAQQLLASHWHARALHAVPAKTGTPEQIQRAILWREVLMPLTPAERRLYIRKRAGFTSIEIAADRGVTAAAIDTQLSRVRQKIRRLLGIRPGGARPSESNQPSDEGAQSKDPDGTDVEDPDDE